MFIVRLAIELCKIAFDLARGKVAWGELGEVVSIAARGGEVEF